MSTLKSDDENLILNAGGADKDIIFQSDDTEKARLDKDGLFTATTIDASKLSGVVVPANLTTAPGDDDRVLTANSAGDLSFDVPIAGGYTNSQILTTASPVWGKPAGVTSVAVYIYGASGGGGGLASSAILSSWTSFKASGGAGGDGSIAFGILPTDSNARTYGATIGAGGTGGATGTSGGTGGTTSFSTDVDAVWTTITVDGGSGGLSGAGLNITVYEKGSPPAATTNTISVGGGMVGGRGVNVGSTFTNGDNGNAGRVLLLWNE